MRNQTTDRIIGTFGTAGADAKKLHVLSAGNTRADDTDCADYEPDKSPPLRVHQEIFNQHSVQAGF
jgi:hypothetical protein